METLGMTVGKRGIVTLPKTIRERYRIAPGMRLTLHDLDGVLVLRPGSSEIDALAEAIQGDLAKTGETLESMISALREERARYGED